MYPVTLTHPQSRFIGFSDCKPKRSSMRYLLGYLAVSAFAIGTAILVSLALGGG